MKYEEIVKSVRDSFTAVDVSDYKNHLAVQFNITGEGEGAFYVELKDGSIDVQPYEYYDRDVIFTLSATDLLALVDGTLDPVKAYLAGKIKVSNTDKALEVKKLIDDINKKKTTTPKKTVAKRTTKKVEPKEETPEVKTETKEEPKKTTKSATKSTAARTTKSTTAKKTSTKTSKAKKTEE